MKRLTLILCCWMVYSSIDAQIHRGKVCVIGFYNLENLYDTIDNPMVNDDEFTPTGKRRYGSAIFRDKLYKLASVIKQIGDEYTAKGPAILGVAEIENDTVLQFLVQHPLLKERKYHIIHAPSKDARGIDVALLYRPDQFFPLVASKLFVPLPGSSKDAYYTRDILYACGRLLNDTVHVYVNHWPSRRGGKQRSAKARMQAALVCRKHMDSIRAVNPMARIVVMGDLNDDPIDGSLTRGLGSVGRKEQMRPDALYNPWEAMYRRGQGTLAHGDSWGLFDQVLFSAGWIRPGRDGLRFHKAHIFNRSFLQETSGRYRGYPMRTWDGFRYRGGYSDHFPVYVAVMDIDN